MWSPVSSSVVSCSYLHKRLRPSGLHGGLIPRLQHRVGEWLGECQSLSPNRLMASAQAKHASARGDEDPVSHRWREAWGSLARLASSLIDSPASSRIRRAFPERKALRTWETSTSSTSGTLAHPCPRFP